MRQFALAVITFALAACGGSAANPSSAEDMASQSRSATPPPLPQVITDVAPSSDGNDVAPAVAPIQASSVTGTVAGIRLQPTYSFFLQGVMRVGDDQPTAVLVVTDTPNLCAHMNRGNMPRNATLLAIAMVQTDGNPIQTQYAYTAPGHHGMDVLPQSMAYFRKLDSNCEFTPDDERAQAFYGQVMLRSLVANQRAVADYAFDFEGDIVTGHIDAPYCNAPYFFANPEQFNMPVEPECCVDP